MMKDVIDVMELQREKLRRVPPFDYRQTEGNFAAAHFIFECGIKLQAQPLTVATATILLHKFFKEVDTSKYDPYLIAASAIYLAGKVKDDQLKIRDVINVAHNTLHRGSSPLELGDEYWHMRDAIVQTELLILRVLKFEVTIVHPHKYMLHYLRSLQGWMDPEQWTKLPIGRLAAGFLQDFHHDPAILNYKPQHIAISCISLALQCYGATLPLADDSEDASLWYSAFTKDLLKETHWELIEKIMEAYKEEPERT